jgi:hypothetical protein
MAPWFPNFEAVANWYMKKRDINHKERPIEQDADAVTAHARAQFLSASLGPAVAFSP